jgi:uncharacterized phage protein (TIGR01671 family)
MKREILFRGRTKAGKWIQGMPTFDLKYIFNENQNDSVDNYEVDPKTIGQFTGLTHKNERKIFEGDILGVGEIPIYKYYVVFENGSFVLNHLKIKDYKNNNLRWGLLSRAFELTQFEFEVIGNIHDNPELMKI